MLLGFEKLRNSFAIFEFRCGEDENRNGFFLFCEDCLVFLVGLTLIFPSDLFLLLLLLLFWEHVFLPGGEVG